MNDTVIRIPYADDVRHVLIYALPYRPRYTLIAAAESSNADLYCVYVFNIPRGGKFKTRANIRYSHFPN